MLLFPNEKAQGSDNLLMRTDNLLPRIVMHNISPMALNT